MAGHGRATTFVSAADGLLGTELVTLLVARGHRVVALTRSVEGAQALSRLGAMPVIGDPLTPGKWQDEAAAEWVLHLTSPLSRGRRLRRNASAAHKCVTLDANMLDAVSPGVTRRIVYVADGTSYAAAGARPITEDEPPCPSPSGRWLVPALDRLNGYVLAGLPIVTAIPGCLYGNGAWFRELVIQPVSAGRRVLRFGTAGPLVSPIHVRDCARAVLHLAEYGKVGGRYFVANSAPVRMGEFAETFARLANRRLRVRRLPAAAARLVVGAAWPEYPRGDAVLSNIRLRAIGFRFDHPTLEDGVRQIVDTLHD
jgi:nucleoside-diphosphate-sugar epimerase